jgi:catecholate siderophore receptor
MGRTDGEDPVDASNLEPAHSAERASTGLGPLIRSLGISLPWLAASLPVHGAPAPAPLTQAGVGDEPPGSPEKAALEPVTINGVRSLLSNKLHEPELDAPQSVTVLGEQLIGAQGASTLEEALRNVPGITMNAGEGAARGDTVNLRGFSAFNDFYLDGVRDAAVYTRDPFDVQSIEVLEGPSAVLFGRGSTGGVINQVSKAPVMSPFEVLTAETGSNDLYRTTADLDAPIARAAAVRLNLMGQSSAVAARDDVRNRRWGVAPSISFGLGQRDSVLLAYLHQQEDDILDTGIPFIGGRPAAVPRGAFFGLASDHATTDADILTVRYRHAFNDRLSLADTLRYGHYAFDYQFAAPNFGASVPAPGTPLGDIVVGRDAPASSGVQTILDAQLDLSAQFSTGFIHHSLFAGLEIARQTSDIARYLNPFNSDNGWIAQTPLLDPNPYQAHPLEPVSAVQRTVAPSGGLYVIDTLGLGPHVDLTAGFRYDQFAARYENLAVQGGALLRLHELNRLGSPRATLLIKPTGNQTYYFSFGTSFDPSAEALTLTPKTAGLGPVKAKSFEVGAKRRLDGGLLLTAAAFRTEVGNAQTNDPDNPTVTVLNGNERVDGIELQASGHVSERWELFGGYTYLDGRTLASGTAAQVGKMLPNAPRNALNLWTEYQLTPALQIGGGGRWLSRRYADGANTAYAPGYVICNAMASFHLSARITVQLNGYNLFNRVYYDGLYYTSAAENHAIPGAGRSVALTVRWSP